MKLLLKSFIILFISFTAIAQEDILPTMAAIKNSITVSGFSGGAYMANQFHVAFSSITTGAGIIAGGHYYCAEGDANKATSQCMKGTSFVDHNKGVTFAQNEYQKGRIDNPDNLKDDSIYLFSGAKDSIVSPRSVLELKNFYLTFLDSQDQIQEEFGLQAAHGFPTLSYGHPCGQSGFFNSPWILNCQYDAAKNILQTLYGPLHPPKEFKKENLIRFDQREFSSSASALADQGHVYIPTSCQQGGCWVHIAFHGCDQDPLSVGEAFTIESGYNRWAESNHLIILYPATKKSYFNPSNPLGCFDWWGYSGPDFHVRSAPQMSAILKMAQRLWE